MKDSISKLVDEMYLNLKLLTIFTSFVVVECVVRQIYFLHIHVYADKGAGQTWVYSSPAGRVIHN